MRRAPPGRRARRGGPALRSVRPAALAALACTGALSLAAAAPARASITELLRLSSNGVEDRAPRVAGQRVVWQRGVGSGAEVFLFDGDSTSPLSSNAVFDGEPWVSGGRVLWKRSSNGIACALQLREGGVTTTITQSLFDCAHDARLAGPFAAWTDDPVFLGDDVLLYDDGSGETDVLGEVDEDEREVRVGEVAGSPRALWKDDRGLWYFDGEDVDPLATGAVHEHQLAGDRAVWVAFDGEDEEVFLFDGASVVQLTDNDYDDDQPQVAGDHVVWRARSGGDTEIHHFDGDSTAPLTNDALDDRVPQVSLGEAGVTIAWTKDDGNDDDLWMFDGCEVTQLTNDDGEDGQPALDGQVVAWVRGTGTSAEVWRARVECEPYCGDGQVDDGEACDDGNATPDDGCSALCQLECGDGTQQPAEQCDDGGVAPGDGCSPQCTIEECGNDILDFGEECEDGNTAPLDGCDAACQLECGNGVPEGAEECDDGDRTSGDGCSSTCLAEVCGNDRVDFGEECDDGNLLPGDGCDAACDAESPAPAVERRCIQALNQRAAALAQAQRRQARACLAAAAAGDTEALGVPATAQACLTNDPKGTIAAAQARTTAAEARKCDPARLPSFGYAGAAAVNAAGVAEPVGLFGDVFGADLDAAVIAAASDPAGARCQADVARRASGLADALLAMAVAEKKRLLRGKPDGTLAVSDEALGRLLLEHLGADPKGRAAAREAKLSDAVLSGCAGVDLDAAFPGCAPSATPSALGDCAARAARCRACRALEAFDGLALDCDAFDDAAADGSC